ncbi:MAG: hypothetical protein A2034_03460, partial [Elusimicrobia bacterium GWA2_38_7]
LLLEFLAEIHFLSIPFLLGFLPFSVYLIPYILLSTEQGILNLQKFIFPASWKKFLFPLFLLSIYSIFSIASSTFNPTLFIKLGLWLILPTFLFTKNIIFSELTSSSTPNVGSGDKCSLRDWVGVLLLWLPIEFGALSGFDITFKPGLTIPALPFVAVIQGLYLFRILRNLPQIGYDFLWNFKDLKIAFLALFLLAFSLIPLGTQMGFIQFSFTPPSFGETVKLILGIYFLVAIPEELLFRGLIQNLLFKSFNGKVPWFLVLSTASIIFGFSHWNNFTPADIRYVFLASLAGLGYGFVYFKTGKTTISALVHCGVNFFWAICFPGTQG